MPATAARFKVLSQHNGNARPRSRSFDTADAALAYGATLAPEVDGTTTPNLDCPALTKAIDNDTYFKGIFEGPNRFAVIIDTQAVA